MEEHFCEILKLVLLQTYENDSGLCTVRAQVLAHKYGLDNVARELAAETGADHISESDISAIIAERKDAQREANKKYTIKQIKLFEDALAKEKRTLAGLEEK
jgi:hypothetical protein